jgi:phage-related protein (TIGR01555 family)
MTKKPATKAKTRTKSIASGDRVIRQRGSKVMGDTYSNQPARIGDFTPNQVNAGEYPLIRRTQNYPLILSLYRSSWIIRRIIDTVANDMYQSFPVLDSEITPKQIKLLSRLIKKTKVLSKLRTACKWGRLFGGAGAIMVIDGHDNLEEPLDLDDIELGSFKGLIPLDRWSGIIPGPEICSDINNPEGFGLPTYYTCVMDAGQVNIHASRILRFTGRELPQWEVQTELYWGMSEVEIIYDELKKRDYSSWNIVSLLTRAQVLSVEDPQLATLMSGAGGTNSAFNNFINRMEAISELLNNQGLLVLGKDGHLQQTSYSFGGISDVYHEFMKDIAAAAEMPYEIIFGREPGSGDGKEGVQLYNNLIEQRRNSEANPIIDQLLPVMAMSVWGKVPDDLDYHWAPITSKTEEENAGLAKSVVESVLMAYNADLVTKKEARKELSQFSGSNGMFSNITAASIASTPDIFASEIALQQQQQQMMMQNMSQPAEGTAPGGMPTIGGQPNGTKRGETLPVESKPKGVQGLKWHASRRITGASVGNPNKGPDMQGKSSAKSLQQTVAHNVKHDMKKPKHASDGRQVFDGAALGLAEPLKGKK